MKTTPTLKPATKAKKTKAAPMVSVRFDDPVFSAIYKKLFEEGKKAERNPTAQTRFVLRQWFESLPS